FAEHMSGLFWGWRELICILFFGLFLVKRAIASFAAATDPAPPISEYKLDISLSTPTFTLTCWAWAAPQARTAANAASPMVFLISVSSFLFWTLKLINR